ELLGAMGIKIIEAPGYEADDILGTCSAFAHGEDDLEAYIITGDRDSFQLIRDNVYVIYKNPKGIKILDRAGFNAEYPGITPESFIDYKAIVGDKSDNIKGIDGIGNKGALDLVSAYGSIENIYCHIGEIKKAGLLSKLEAGREDAKFSRFLSKILLDAPIGVTLEDIAVKDADTEKVTEICSRLQMSKILDGIKELAAGKNGQPAGETVSAYPMGELLPFNITKIANTAAVWENGAATVVSDGKNSFSADESGLKALLDDGEREITVADSKSVYLRFGDVKAKLFDVSLAAYVIKPNGREQDLKGMAMEYLRCPLEGEYDGARVLYDIAEAEKKLLSDTKQEYVYNEIELPLARVLADMENVGFRVDRNGLESFGEYLGKLADGYRDTIYGIAGREFNINSTKQLGTLLFEELGLPSSKKTKSGYSTDIEVLEGLIGKHPIIEPIIEFRRVTKLRSTYAVGLLAVADGEGRIHSTFNQKVAATGRLSSSDPNLQNIPIRTELGREMRKFFIPKDGYKLIDADYSQIELRVLASVSGDANMSTAFILGEDIHTRTAASVFGVRPSEVTPDMRKSAKTINFGIIYGMSAFSLASDIGVSRKEAGDYIRSYFDGFPMIDGYLRDCVDFAKENGYVTTAFGRRRYIEELKSPKASLRQFGERAARNSPIQGTAADIIKIAMINVCRRLKAEGIDARLILQVHDELILEAAEECAGRAEAILKEEMENAAELGVPLVADTGIGDNWLECHN
ncbi:MAG: DNA polymerase I, partial [Firmicutes bacterium]|nr:DNA polymerase I [Candidatus Colimorpha enterica]